MAELTAIVRDTSLQAVAETVAAQVKASKRGELVIIDFYTQMAMEGRAYQVRAGTITTLLVGDVVITDTAAEACADAASGTTIIPVQLSLGIRLSSGTSNHEYAAKSVGAVSTVGTAFVPLNLRIGGAAATSTARVMAAGGVTVAAELATTTRRHWNFTNPVAGGTGHDSGIVAAASHAWNPRIPPVLVGPACFYVQV